MRVTVRTTEYYDERFGERFGEQPEEQSIEITLKGFGYDPRARDPHRLRASNIMLFTTHVKLTTIYKK